MLLPLLGGILLHVSGAGAAESALSLRIGFEIAGERQELRTLTLEEIKALESHTSFERDPLDGKTVRWQGVPLKSMIEQAIEKLPAEKKALVDLVILKGDGGAEALVPRSFIVKYPMKLAHSRDGAGIKDRGPLYSVVPWTSEHKKVVKEGLPIETYFVPQIREVVLANYRDRYRKIFLKRRTNPAAVRGERLFSQSCTSCHGAGRGPSVQNILTTGVHNRSLADSAPHPATSGLPEFKARDWRAFSDYIEAYRFENPVKLTESGS